LFAWAHVASGTKPYPRPPDRLAQDQLGSESSVSAAQPQTTLVGGMRRSVFQRSGLTCADTNHLSMAPNNPRSAAHLVVLQARVRECSIAYSAGNEGTFPRARG